LSNFFHPWYVFINASQSGIVRVLYPLLFREIERDLPLIIWFGDFILYCALEIVEKEMAIDHLVL